MKLYMPRVAGSLLLLGGISGCAGFFEELTSHERDWSYVFNRNKPDPLVVLKNSDDGLRRAQALNELQEPVMNGGDAKKQEVYLQILSRTAKDDQEPLCRLAAIRTLGKYRDPMAARTLEGVYQQQPLPFNAEINSMVRKEALVALENTHDDEARHLLIRVARQPGPTPDASQTDRLQTQDEKIIAIRALGNYRKQECVDALAYVLKTEKDVALRDLALRSLEENTGRKWPDNYEAWQKNELRPQPGLAQNNNHTFIQQVGGFFGSGQR